MQVAERVLGIAADRGVGHPDGRYGFGSGFLIAGRAVLTCAHVVADARTVLLNDAVGKEYTGRVVRLGDPRLPGTGTGPDLAVVEIDDPGLDASPFPVAEIDRTGMGSLESVRVVGWPRFMEAPGGAARSTYSAVGKIEDLTRRREALLRVDVSGSPPANVESGSPWQGFSGAPVFADGHLVGVVTTHGLPEGPSALTAIPLATELADDWWPSLGITRSFPLHIVRPGPAGPACVVHHQTVLRSLNGYRSSLLYDVMPYVEPRPEAAWHPRNLWQRLRADDGPNAVLVSGHGGIGKTRTLLEVAGLAVRDGWTVLHVRPGNAAGVVDHLAAVVRSSFAPVLLVVDYLNQSMAKDLDLPQLLALVQQSRRGSSPHLAVLASARTGWLLTPFHSRDVVALEKIRLEPEAEDLRAICAFMAQAVAPRAAEQLGLDTLLGYTDTTRPILTLLVARQIEDRVTRGLPALPRASMDAQDLRQWLEFRLDEDQLVPRLDSPESLWGPEVQVHIKAAAAVFLATPGDESALLDAASDMFGDRASAANLLRLIIEMGWLISSDGVLDSVHDVVTDFLVTGVVFWSTTRAPRPTVTAQLMNAVGGRLASLEHALVALGRLVDDIDESDRAADLVSQIDRWFGEHRDPVIRLLLQDPGDGARTAAVMVSSGMLTTTRQAYWDHAFSPLLTRLGGELEAFSLLLAAVRDLSSESQNVTAELADHAIAWLTGRPLAKVEQLLRLLLRRDDLPPDRARAAVGLAVGWLHLHSRDAWSDFLLSSTLMCDILDHEADPDLERLTGFALEWLAANGTQLGASYLLRAMSRIKHLPGGVVAPLVTRALSWLRAHGETIDASFVLPGFLSNAAVPQERVHDFVGAARAWLAQHSTRPEATYVLAHLLTRQDLDGEAVAETFDHTRRWIEQNSDDPTADYLIRRALTHPALPSEMATVVRAATSDWLSSYGTLETACYLLQVVIQADGLSDELRSTAYATAETWLQTHGRRLSANYLLQVTIQTAGLPDGLRGTAYTAAQAWLQAHSRHHSANYLLQVVIQADGLPEGLRTTAYAAAETWLQIHGQHLGANYLLQVVIQADGLPDGLRSTAFAAAETWLQTHGDHYSASHLLQSLVSAADLPEESRGVTFAVARAWLQTHGRHHSANYLLQVIIHTDGLPDELRTTAYAAAEAWLQTHGRHHSANYLLQVIIHTDGLPDGLRTTAYSASDTWLQVHSEHLTARHLLQALLEADVVPAETRALVVNTAASWLDLWWQEASSVGVLRALLRVVSPENTPGVPAGEPDTIARLTERALQWLSCFGSVKEARSVIGLLLRSQATDEQTRHRVLQAAVGWLNAQAASSRASDIIPEVLDSTDLPEEFLIEAFRAAQIWLCRPKLNTFRGRYVIAALFRRQSEYPDRVQAVAAQYLTVLERGIDAAQSRFALSAFLAEPGLDCEIRKTVLRLTRTWLTRFAEQPPAHVVLATMAAREDLTSDETEWFEQFVWVWLGRNEQAPTAGPLARALRETAVGFTPALHDELARIAQTGSDDTEDHPAGPVTRAAG
ncbi:serine protease [Plantactinospora sonchi]|uniref:Serine protease n=1 Tax=Plantactinospora sonchi TaxID=1544735 RepID=A0ABU7S1X6_9ACTN